MPETTEQTEMTFLPANRPKGKMELIDLDELPKSLAGPRPSQKFIDNVKALGVLQPIVVVRHNDKLQLAEGRRRVIAAREAGLEKIRATVFESWDGARAILTLSTNSLRSDNPVAELEAIQDLVKRGAGEQTIAAETGMPLGRIRCRMKLMNLNDDLRKAFGKGKISVSVATAASKLPPKTQKRLAAKLEANGKLTSADLQEEKSVIVKTAVEALPNSIFQPTAETWRDRALKALRSALGELPNEYCDVAEAITDAIDQIETQTGAAA